MGVEETEEKGKENESEMRKGKNRKELFMISFSVLRYVSFYL